MNSFRSNLSTTGDNILVPVNLHKNIHNSSNFTFEANIEDLTMLNKNVPKQLRGTYLGAVSPWMLEFYEKSGIKELQFMPVLQAQDEKHLVNMGKVNHWGYNLSDFKHVTTRYATQSNKAEDEFALMVEKLKSSGISTILDVAHNHVHEDQAHKFNLWSRDKNFSGCCNTLNLELESQRVLDSLKYLAQFGIDGFRHDLAPVLCREGDGDFNPNSKLMNQMLNDSVLGKLSHSGEPWDLGCNGKSGYHLGEFPQKFTEHNDKFREDIRQFFIGHLSAKQIGYVLMGSQEHFPNLNVSNFINVHDGYTLYDLVRTHEKQNWANGEDNRDGDNHTYYLNSKGGLSNEQNERRRDLATAGMFMALGCSLGHHLSTVHDLVGHSKGGNNNSYCQNNSINWIDYETIENGGSKKHIYDKYTQIVKHSQDVIAPFNKACLEQKLGSHWDWTGEKSCTLTLDAPGGHKLETHIGFDEVCTSKYSINGQTKSEISSNYDN